MWEILEAWQSQLPKSNGSSCWWTQLSWIQEEVGKPSRQVRAYRNVYSGHTQNKKY